MWPAEGHPAIDALTGVVDDQEDDDVRPADGNGDGEAFCDVGAIEVTSGSGEDDSTRPVGGTVYDERTGEPMSGVCVFAAGIDDPDDGGMFPTGADGRWSAEAPDGSYLVGFFVPAEPVDPDEVRDDGKNSCGETGFAPEYQPEWYRNVAIEVEDDGSPVFPSPEQVELVVVDGAGVSGIDACLGPGPGPGLDAPCGPPETPTTTAPPGTPTVAGGNDAARARGARVPSRLAFVG